MNQPLCTCISCIFVCISTLFHSSVDQWFYDALSEVLLADYPYLCAVQCMFWFQLSVWYPYLLSWCSAHFGHINCLQSASTCTCSTKLFFEHGVFLVCIKLGWLITDLWSWFCIVRVLLSYVFFIIFFFFELIWTLSCSLAHWFGIGNWYCCVLLVKYFASWHEKRKKPVKGKRNRIKKTKKITW